MNAYSIRLENNRDINMNYGGDFMHIICAGFTYETHILVLIDICFPNLQADIYKNHRIKS